MITIKLSDEQFKELEERAKKSGFANVSDYIKSYLFPQQPQILPVPAQEAKPSEKDQQLIRTIQDMINPFTAKVDELARAVAEMREQLDKIEDKLSAIPTTSRTSTFRGQSYAETRRSQARPTAIERLSSEGAVFQSELSWLRNPKAFFDKLKREGAIVISLEKEFIAVDSNFWEEFKDKLSKMSEKDPNKVQKALPEKMASLFKKLYTEGKAIYDDEAGGWIITEELES